MGCLMPTEALSSVLRVAGPGAMPAGAGVMTRPVNQVAGRLPPHFLTAGDRERSGNLGVGNAALCQLSYARMPIPENSLGK
jgi:hypothetical protein